MGIKNFDELISLRRADTRAVYCKWTRNDGGAVLVAREPVSLEDALLGRWTPNGYTLTEWSSVQC